MKYLTILTILGFIIFPAYSKSNTSSLSFNHLNKGDGLSDDLVFSLFQDSRGYIWIGTSSGLNRYDGYKFKKFFHIPEDQRSIPHNVITSICEDEEKNLWIATYGGGISKFNPGKNNFKNYLSFDNIKNPDSSKIINHIKFDSKGILWISTKDEGLMLFDPKSSQVKQYKHDPDDPGSISSNKIMSSFEDSNGNIWVATWGGGFCKYSEENDSFQKILPVEEKKKDICCQYIHTILEDAENNLWLGTKNTGLVKYERLSGKFQSFGIENHRKHGLKGEKITTIFSDPGNDNLIWVGTENGLFIYKIFEDSLISYGKGSDDSGLSHKYIWSIMRDRSGLLWIGTVGGGLNIEIWGSEYFSKFSNNGGDGYSLSSNVIGSIYSNTNDPSTLWAGTLGNGLNKINLRSGKIESFISGMPEASSIPPRYITCITSDLSSPEYLFIGSNSGLLKYNIEKKLFTKLESPLKKFIDFNSTFISTLMTSKLYKDFLWIGTFGKGLYRLDLNNFDLTNYQFQKEYKNNPDMNRVYTIKQSISDPGVLWIGTNIGVGKFIINSNTFKLLKLPESGKSLENIPVLSICESKEQPGILWLGTKGNGLLRLDNAKRKFLRLSEADGLPDNTIVSIVEEPKEHLWLGTLNGLSHFNIKTGNFRNFDCSEGLQNTEFNLNASFISSDRKLFFGGSKGIDFFCPEKLDTNICIPQIVLTGLEIFGSTKLPGMDQILENDISTTNEIRLPNNYNSITIHFAALDFSSPEKNQYSCIMEGFEDKWQYLGNTNHVLYEELKPGNYIFKVRGANSSSIWNNNYRSLSIIIIPHFTGSLWFRVLLFLFLILFILLLRTLRKKLKLTPALTGKTSEQLFQDNIITLREKEIINLILKGKSNKEIEEELYISLGTVKNHLYNIYKKLNIKSRTQLVSLLRSDNRK